MTHTEAVRLVEAWRTFQTVSKHFEDLSRSAAAGMQLLQGPLVIDTPHGYYILTVQSLQGIRCGIRVERGEKPT